MTHLAKMKKTWTGKKTETDPLKKEAHKDRKTKVAMIHEQQEKEWEQQVKEYTNGKT